MMVKVLQANERKCQPPSHESGDFREISRGKPAVDEPKVGTLGWRLGLLESVN